MKKIVISGYYGFNNFGDEVVLDILVNALRGEDVDITVLSKNPEETSRLHEVNSFATFNLADVIHQIFVCDMLISGGGSLLQDKTSVASFFYYLFVIFTGLIFKKKVVIFSQGIEPLKNKYLGKILFRVLRHVDYISIRDIASFNYLKTLGLKSKKVADTAWLLPHEPVKDNGKVVIQLRNYEGFDEEKQNILAKAIIKTYPNQPIQVLSIQDGIDLNVCNQFAQKLEQADMDVEVLSDLSSEESIEAISKAKYLIAMRYHVCLVAIKQEVPVFVISYDDKVKNLAGEFKLPYIELGTFYKGRILKGLERMLDIKANHGLIFEKEKGAKTAIDDILRLVDSIEVFD